MPANYDGSNDDLAKRKNNAAEKIIIDEKQTESSTSDANTNLPDQTKKPEQSNNKQQSEAEKGWAECPMQLKQNSWSNDSLRSGESLW